MANDKLDISKLLNNEAVTQQVTSHLDDYSATYPFSVVAASELLEGKLNKITDIPGGLTVSVKQGTASSTIVQNR